MIDRATLQLAQLQKLLKRFLDQHGAAFHLQALGYFGSYARGEAGPESDVDIVFHTDRPDLLLTAMLKQDLEALLQRSVDVVRFRESMNPRLMARIQREAQYV